MYNYVNDINYLNFVLKHKTCKIQTPQSILTHYKFVKKLLLWKKLIKLTNTCIYFIMATDNFHE